MQQFRRLSRYYRHQAESYTPLGSGLSRVEFNVRLKLRWNAVHGVDGVHWTLIHTSHAIDAFFRVNNQLLV